MGDATDEFGRLQPELAAEADRLDGGGRPGTARPTTSPAGRRGGLPSVDAGTQSLPLVLAGTLLAPAVLLYLVPGAGGAGGGALVSAAIVASLAATGWLAGYEQASPWARLGVAFGALAGCLGLLLLALAVLGSLAVSVAHGIVP